VQKLPGTPKLLQLAYPVSLRRDQPRPRTCRIDFASRRDDSVDHVNIDLSSVGRRDAPRLRASRRYSTILNGGRDLDHGRNRGSYRGPSDDRVRNGRGRSPNSPRKILLPRNGALSSGRRRRGDGSNIRHATGIVFQRDTNSRLPKSNPAQELAGGCGSPAAGEALRFARQPKSARNLSPPPVTIVPVAFSSWPS